jgi:mycothione reductase
MTEVYSRRFPVRLGSEARRVSMRDGSVAIELGPSGEPDAAPSEIIVCDSLLVATGRVSNADRLDVAATGVETDERGFVRTDEFMRTDVEGIWALGDIVGRYQLKHNANLEAAHVANNVLDGDQMAAVDYHAMPSAIFGSPQIGSVGLTEQAAEESGIPYAVATYDYDRRAYGAAIEDHDGFVKVLVDPRSNEILGCHVIGHDASVLVQEAANVMRFRLPIDVIAQSIYIHPALPEVMQAAFASAAAQVAQMRDAEPGHGHGQEAHAEHAS